MSQIPFLIAERLKAAAATPVKNGNTLPRQIAIDKAIAWCKYTYPQHFQGDSYEPPQATGRGRRGTPQSKADGSGS